MDLKQNLLIALASVAWIASPVALSQEPTESPSADETDVTSQDSTSAAEDFDEGATADDPATDFDAGAPADDPSTAQEPAGAGATTPGAPSTVDASSLDDQKLEQFANAYAEVQTIQQKAMTDLQSTTDPAAADKVKMDAESSMIAAVERNGLKVDEFNQIVQTMASNVDVRNRVAEKLQKRSGG